MTPCQRLAIEARFLSYVRRMPNGCMIWVGGQSYSGGVDKRKRGGPYGTFNVSKDVGPRRAHIVWAWLAGRIDEPRVPEGHHLDHTCESGTLCVSCTDLTPIPEHRKRPIKRHANADARVASLDVAREERLARVKAGTFGQAAEPLRNFG